MPVISFWATSARLANAALFPTFMRTVASDAAGAYFAARLVSQMGYKRCGLLYENSDFGTAFNEKLFTELALVDVTLKFQAFVTADQLTTTRAMQAIKQTKLNVIFVVCYTADLATLAQAYKEEQMDQQEVLLIFLTLDSPDVTLNRINGNDDIAKLIHGSLYFAPRVQENQEFERFKQKFANNEFVQYTDRIDDMFQPNGAADEDWTQSCANANISYTLPSPTFLGGDRADYAFDIWATTFDAVITAGVALCKTRPVDPLPPTLDETFELQLSRNATSVRFAGLSGQVSFDPMTGDRDRQSLQYTLINFKRTGVAQATYSVVGDFSHAGDKWALNATAITWKGVGQPSETLKPEENRNYLPYGLKLWGYIAVALMNACCLLCILWLLINSSNKVVINAQGSLLLVMCVGCMIASWSVLALTVDDQITDMLDENISCMVAPVLFSIGFQLALLALLGKIYRIYVLFKQSSRLKAHRVSTANALSGVALVMSAELVVMICWIAIAPLKYERLSGNTDEFGNVLNSYGQCSGGPTSVAFVGVLFGAHAFALTTTFFASQRVKDLPVEFQESRYLNLAILSMTQLYLIAVPTVVASYANVVGRFVIMSTVVILTVAALLLFLIAPKIVGLSKFSFVIAMYSGRVNTSDDDAVKHANSVRSPAHLHGDNGTSSHLGGSSGASPRAAHYSSVNVVATSPQLAS
jgi:hypothetical protein